MLSMIGDLLNAIKDGRWSDAASIGALLNKAVIQPDASSALPVAQLNAIKDKPGILTRSIKAVSSGWRGEYAQIATTPGNIRPVAVVVFVRLVLRWKAGRP